MRRPGRHAHYMGAPGAPHSFVSVRTLPAHSAPVPSGCTKRTARYDRGRRASHPGSGRMGASPRPSPLLCLRLRLLEMRHVPCAASPFPSTSIHHRCTQVSGGAAASLRALVDAHRLLLSPFHVCYELLVHDLPRPHAWSRLALGRLLLVSHRKSYLVVSRPLPS